MHDSQIIIDFNIQPTGDTLVWPIFESEGLLDCPVRLLAPARKAFERAASASRFTGKAGQVVEILAPDFCAAGRALLLGVGPRDDADPLAWQAAGASLVRRLATSGAREAALMMGGDAASAAHAALGARLASYRFDAYRTDLSPDKRPSLVRLVLVHDAVTDAQAVFAPLGGLADGVALARDLVSTPPNILNPESFAERVSALAGNGLAVEIVDEAGLEALGMCAMLAVGQGSRFGSRMAVMRWTGATDPDASPLILVGKGLTFDSGGISIKPAANMEAMKGDMAGAAAVVGAMVSLAKRRACANVVGIVGLVENMPGGNAFRPGDVLIAASGRTIEVVNTDAEGRLVLCDLLHHAQTAFAPRAIVDLATLTGAIIMSLGHEHAGLFANDDDLADAILAAGKTVGEPAWRLPMGTVYDRLITSEIADIKNSTSGGAGSITAAQFLQRFIVKDTPWAHLDIAGTAWKDKRIDPMEPSWATGYGVRLLDRLVADRFEG